MAFLKNEMRRLIGVMLSIGLLASGNSVSAQNLVSNPDFDNDFLDWTNFFPSQISISRTMDFRTPESTAIRSMQIDSAESGTPHIAFAVQCVDVHEQFVYVATAEVNSHCPGQQFYLFWADASCTAGDSMLAQSTRPDEWERLTITAQAPLGTQKALVVLENPATCAGSAYFDAITLQLDAIFSDGFEEPTPP
ncbi:MAG: hypothetical protein ABJB01_06455 [Rudaea sp.]